MFRVQIKDENNFVTNEGVFSTQAEIEVWYEFNYDYFPVPHTRHITSIVDELLDKRRDQESDEAISLGEALVKKIRKINRRKLRTGVWTQDQFNALLVNATAAKIERALWNGSLTTAKYFMTQMSEFYSDIEIAEFIASIDAHELKWVELI